MSTPLHSPSHTTSTTPDSDHDAYDDIFDRLDSDLPVLVLRTTTEAPYNDAEDGLSLTTASETFEQENTSKYIQKTDGTDEVVDDSGVDFYSLEANETDGTPFDFAQLRGKYVLITNVASMCGMTWQMKFLEDLHRKYKDRGVVVIGFPSNSFCQEWLSSENATACYSKIFKCSFKVMEKIRVNGKKQHQVFRYLKENKKGLWGMKTVKWNFEKFLVNPEGKIIRRYSTLKFPNGIMHDLETILKEDEERFKAQKYDDVECLQEDLEQMKIGEKASAETVTA